MTADIRGNTYALGIGRLCPLGHTVTTHFRTCDERQFIVIFVENNEFNHPNMMIKFNYGEMANDSATHKHFKVSWIPVF